MPKSKKSLSAAALIRQMWF